MFKYYNPQLVKQYRSYTIEQLCELFKGKKLRPQTVREWVKSGELETVNKKPITVYGEVLKAFLEKRNVSHKKQLEFNQFKCLKCKEFIFPQDNTISIYKNKNGSIKAMTVCSSCNSETTRFYKKNEQVKLEETFIINKAALFEIKPLGN
ncbi:MAG: helix-turn-helix domain-containing protein [Legionellaceae bacterium]|nr:helix-turn-helix domain-containing protein [Legionellaceae bacterium]